MPIDLTTAGTIGITTVVTLGLFMIFMTGQFQGAQAAFMGIGAYVTALLVGHGVVPAAIAVIAGTLAALVAGAVIGTAIRRLRAFYLAIATLSFGQVLVLVATNVQALGGAQGLYVAPQVSATAALAIMAVCLIVLARFSKSRHAVIYRASTDEALARAFGVDIARARLQSFALGCGVGGLGGGLYVLYYGVIGPTEIGFLPSLLLVIYIAFGGLDTVLGSLLGVGVLVILQESLRATDEVRYVVYGVVIVLLMIFRSRGLLYRRPLGARSRLQDVAAALLSRVVPGRAPIPARPLAAGNDSRKDAR